MKSAPTSPAPQVTSAVEPTAADERHPADLCRYAGKRCFNPRATKRNGEHHSLCHTHRVRANQNQRRMELKRRLSRHREDSARAIAYSSAHSRAMYSAFRIAASTGSISTTAYSPSSSPPSVYSSPSSPQSSLSPPFSAACTSASNALGSMAMGDIDAHLGWDVSSTANGQHQYQQHHHYQQHQQQVASWHSAHHHHQHYHHAATVPFPSASFAAPADYTLEAIVAPVVLNDGSYSFEDLSCSVEMAKDDEIARMVLEFADSRSLQHESPLDFQPQQQHSQSDMWTVPNFLLTL